MDSRSGAGMGDGRRSAVHHCHSEERCDEESRTVGVIHCWSKASVPDSSTPLHGVYPRIKCGAGSERSRRARNDGGGRRRRLPWPLLRKQESRGGGGWIPARGRLLDVGATLVVALSHVGAHKGRPYGDKVISCSLTPFDGAQGERTRLARSRPSTSSG